MKSRQKTAIAVRHVAFEDLGLLEPLLDEAGYIVTYREAALDDLIGMDKADLVIVLGGPIGVYQTDAYPFVKTELEFLEKRIAARLPTLGICLGCQLMAYALGARVYSSGHREIGYGKVVLTQEGLRSPLRSLASSDAAVLHWHGDTFELPVGAVRLAHTDTYANQAFSFGNEILALQFHIEADPRRLESWYVGHAAELRNLNISVESLRARAISLPIAQRQVDDIFGRWLSQLGDVV